MTESSKAWRFPVPRGLSRPIAAAYIGVGTSKFDGMVADGRMPQPKVIDGRRVWDIRELDTAFDELPSARGDGVVSVRSVWEGLE